jgi:hypothetical protein
MQTNHFYNLLAKIVVKTGYDYENDPELTGTERESIRQGLRDIEFFSPAIKARVGSQTGGSAESARKTKRVS